MRVSNSMMSHNLILRLGQSTERLFRLQEEMASGLRITKPSDDPVGAVHAAALKSALAAISQYRRNAEEADSLLGMTDSALAEISNLLQSAKTAGLAGVTDTADQQTRQALAQEIEQTMQAVLRTANSSRTNRFLFAGYKTADAPFSLDLADDPPATYIGDSGVSLFEVGRSSFVAVNLPGDEVFNMGGADDPALPDLFSSLDGLREALLAGDTVELQNRLQEVDAHLTRVLNFRAEVGARQQGIELALNRLTDTELSLRTSLSNTEDADLTKVMVELQAQQNIYQATAGVAATLAQGGLMEYMTR